MIPLTKSESKTVLAMLRFALGRVTTWKECRELEQNIDVIDNLSPPDREAFLSEMAAIHSSLSQLRIVPVADVKYDNSFILSRNEKKEKESQPDFRGNATVNGVEYWISAWIGERDGRRFFKGKFEPKEKAAGQAPQGGYAAQLNDDVPFAPEWR